MGSLNLKYNYVIFASLDVNPSDFMHVMYNDFQGHQGIKFIDTPFEGRRFNKLFRFLHKYHFHGYLNKFFDLPFKSLWNKYYYSEVVECPQKLCFVFFMPSLVKANESFFKYLRRNYPGCKMVVYFEDIVASREKNGKNTLCLDFVDKYFDLALSYDLGDCHKYGFQLYPTSYSVININNNPEIADSDLFFCGAAKERYDNIIDIYNKCIGEDVKCDFIIARYGGSKKNYGIRYVPYVMQYSEYLEHMIKSNCLLDVIQEGSTGFTVRVWEALVYGKKMLTNNKAILNAPFYDEKQFCYFEYITSKEISFIKERSNLHPRNVYELSPLRFLEYIDRTI